MTTMRAIWTMKTGSTGYLSATVYGLRTRQLIRRAWCSVGPDGLSRSPIRRTRAAAFTHVRLELVPELLDGRQHRRRRRVAEGAQRLAGNVVRDAEQQLDVVHTALAPLDLPQHVQEPGTPFATRGALATGLVPVEAEEVLRHPDHAGR